MSARPDAIAADAGAANPIFIVGLYKNGTTWLLSALAAHPEFVALRELDVLRSMAGDGGRRLLPVRKRLAKVFGKSGFCGLKAEHMAPDAWRAHLSDPPRGVTQLYDLPAQTAVAVLASMLRADGNKGRPGVAGRPLAFMNFEAGPLEHAFAVVRDAATPQAAMDGFLAALAPGYPSGRRLVLKGADQIRSLAALREYYPHAPKLVIVRDGRDAAVSAFHYRRVMRAQRMAWHYNHLSFVKPYALARDAVIDGITVLRGLAGYGPDALLGRSMWVWADRVRKVLAAAERGEVKVVRYEDLLADFEGEFGKLLAWLGADHSQTTLKAIAKASSFETMSGRPRGVSGESVVRKGVAGEWREELSARDQALAWRVAGAELTAMGYARDGEPRRFELPGG